VPDDLDRPVSMARARAAEYTEQVTAQVLTLTATLNTVLAELRTLGDPAAAAVQIDAVTAEAEQRVAVAAARAARAEQDRGITEQHCAEADAAAEEATTMVENLTGQLTDARQAQAVLQAELDQARRPMPPTSSGSPPSSPGRGRTPTSSGPGPMSRQPRRGP
jgi:chromosome segregation ATPase